jgi:release factor glutamine methyltransferase
LQSNSRYEPAEDTFFLADHIQNERGQSALEIGTGSGYLTKILEKNFELVVATDIDHTTISTQDERIQNGICCVSADALGAQFDLVVCNLPYLPSEKITDRTVDGGKEGLEIPIQIIKSAKYRLKPGAKMLYLTSSLANYTKLMRQTELMGFDVRVLAKKKLFFEELIIVQAILVS